MSKLNLFILGAAAAIVACASSNEQSSSASGEAGGAGGAATSTGGGTTTSSGGGSLAGFGAVFVDVGPSFTSLFGFFGPSDNSTGTGGGCTTQTFGDCNIDDCTALGGGGAPPNVSAGTLSVKTGSLSIVAMPMMDGSYNQLGPVVQPWSDGGGEDVAFTAAGDVAPMFSVHLASPGVVHVSSPSFPTDPTTPMSIPTNADIDVTWTGGASSSTVFVNLDDNMSSGLVFGVCSFSAASGKGTIPAGALAWLKGKNGSLSVSSSTQSSTITSGWQIDALAGSSGVTPQGQDASSYNVDFQ